MVLIFTQMVLQKTAEEIEDVLPFFIRHSLDKGSGKRVIGYLLEIVNKGVLIRVTIQTETDKALKGFDKTMGVFHHVWYISS